MSVPTHAPLPSTVEARTAPDGTHHLIRDADKVIVVRVLPSDEHAWRDAADCDLIVRAVNSHTDLVAACRALLALCRARPRDAALQRVADLAADAVALAEGVA
jgi:hypothetical protein